MFLFHPGGCFFCGACYPCALSAERQRRAPLKARVELPLHLSRPGWQLQGREMPCDAVISSKTPIIRSQNKLFFPPPRGPAALGRGECVRMRATWKSKCSPTHRVMTSLERGCAPHSSRNGQSRKSYLIVNVPPSSHLPPAMESEHQDTQACSK